MAIVDFGALTFNIEEARSSGELIITNPYQSPEITEVHSVQTGVIMDKYIPILGQIEDIGIVDPGACGVNTFTGTVATSQKQWSPKLLSSRLVVCKDDIPAKIKFWMAGTKAAGLWELINNEYQQFVYDRAALAMKRAVIRIADFGDTAAEVVANGGHLTAGTVKALYNMLDGMWKQVFTDQAGAKKIYRYTIAENSGATYAAQNALATGTALSVFRALYTGIDPTAFDGNPVFQITKSLFDEWQSFLEDKSLVFQLTTVEQGATMLQFRGYPIIVRKDWDRIIKKDFNDGVALYLPHRAIFTDLNNIPIGTSDTESFTAMDAFYDKTQKKHFTDIAWKEDVKILQEEIMAVAY